MFAVRIVTADYYNASPIKDLDVCYSEFRETDVKKVPVVRIFGATPAGQKTCLHLHGIFPYIYVPYDGYGQQPEHYLRQMAFSIDRALNVAMGNPASNNQHVFKVVLVSGMPFYGYHAKEKQFMKIYLYNPQMVKRVCELLQGGAVMNKSYQPHEGHIPYLLQLFIDYNLYGMNLLNMAAVKFRRSPQKEGIPNVPAQQAPGSHHGSSPWKSPCTSKLNDSNLGGTFARWEEDAIPCSLILGEVERQSTCQLEVDAVAADILNHLEIDNQIGRNPGLQAIWEDEKLRRREKNQASQIETPESQDRGSVSTTESERVFMKRFKEILKENDFDVTQSGAAPNSDEEDEVFSSELSLHPDHLSPEGVSCTPANLVEVHRDSQPDSARSSSNVHQEAVVDEEAILSLLENSQTFLPLSQRASHSPILDNSQDQAMVDLLAGLADDDFCGTPIRQNSRSQSLPGAGSCHYNSDEEEAAPELDREEAELSVLMSQRWDNDPSTRSLSDRPHQKEKAEDCLSDAAQESSDDEMDWSGSNSLFANLSIPQLDGAADESSDSSLTDSSSRTHSSLTVTDKLLTGRNPFPGETVHPEPPSSAKTLLEGRPGEARRAHTLDAEEQSDKLFLSKSSQDGSSDCSTGFKVNKEIPYLPPVKHPIPCMKAKAGAPEVSQVRVDEQGVRPLYAYEKKPPLALDEAELDGFPFGGRKTAQSKKKYGGTNCLSILQNHRAFSLCYSELRNCSAKTELDLPLTLPPAAVEEEEEEEEDDDDDDFPCATEAQEEDRGQESDEGDVGELKIRYEDYQENKSERTIVAQQEAHYKFFPSVILSNCLSRKKAGNTKLVDACSKQEQAPPRRSRLKLSKRRLGVGAQRKALNGTENHSSDAPVSPRSAGLAPISPAQPVHPDAQPTDGEGRAVSGEETPNDCPPLGPESDTQQRQEGECTMSESITETITEYTLPPPPGPPASDLTTVLVVSGPPTAAAPEDELGPPPELPCKDSIAAAHLPGSKYTLRAKRKMMYDGEDCDKLGAARVKSAPSAKDRLKEEPAIGMQELKYHKRRKKEPPIIIKYIIINRFKGQKNMLVKMAKVSAEEKWVVLTPKKVERYNKLAPLKDFWPKVPESSAVKFPIAEPKPKKQPKRKSKVNTVAKKAVSISKPLVRHVKKAKGCRRGQILPTLPLPRPSYCELAEDHDTNYTDVMVEMGYLSERCPSPADSTPPRCWSPSDPLMDAAVSSDQLMNPLIDPCLSSVIQDFPATSSATGVCSKNKFAKAKKPRKARTTTSKAASKLPDEEAKKEKTRQTGGSASKRKKKEAEPCEGTNCMSTLTTKPRRSRKKKAEEPQKPSVSKDPENSQIIFPGEELPSSESSQSLPPFQQPLSTTTQTQDGSQTESHSSFLSQSIQPKVENFEASIMEVSQSVLPTDQSQCQVSSETGVKAEAAPVQCSDTKVQPLPEHTISTPAGSPHIGPINGHIPTLAETPSGLAVLKKLLQKRQQVRALPVQTVGTEGSNTTSLDTTTKPAKCKRAPSTTPRKPRAQRVPKEKKPRGRKAKGSSTQPEPVVKQEPVVSDGSPIFLSDPGLDSCYFIEDSLSPELPHNYTFDINAIDQTQFSSPYSSSQFLLTDKNLPLKFLSDVTHDAVPALALSSCRKMATPGDEFQRSSDWHRAGPLSPDLFDRSENVEAVTNHLVLFDSENIVQSREGATFLGKSHSLSPFQDFHCERKELLFSAFDPILPLPLSSASFADNEGSPTGDLPEGGDVLTSTTPGSSPRSVSSLSQMRAGSQLLRGAAVGAHILKPLMSPPSREEILSTLLDLEMSEATFQEPFCSDPSDAPAKPMEVGGCQLTVGTRLAGELPEFSGDLSLEGLLFWKTAFSAMTRPAAPPSSQLPEGEVGEEGAEAVRGAGEAGASRSDRKVALLPCRSPPSRERVQLWLEARRQYQRLQTSRGRQGEAGGASPAAETYSALRTQRSRKLSPTSSGPPAHSAPGASHTLEEEGNEDGSPELPPWQRSGPPERPEGLGEAATSPGPSLSPDRTGERLLLGLSPFPRASASDGRTSPHILHSTPFHGRGVRGSRGDPEHVCSTPADQGEPVSQRLQQRRRSQADPLRRVLLATQVKNQYVACHVPKRDSSEIEGPSITNSYGFKVSMQNLQDAKALHEVQHLTLMCMELHARTRRDLEPDPEFDPVCALFYCLNSDAPLPDSPHTRMTGAIVVDKDHQSSSQGRRSTAPLLVRSGISGLQVTYASDEKQLFQEMVAIMRRFDPDILVGYEVQMHSWGYLLQRASALGVDLCQQLSRVPGDSKENRFAADRDEYGADTMTEISIVGRITLNLWRVMKTEVTLNNYSFENVAFHLLHQRFPLYSPRTLSDWFDHNTDLYRWKMVDHYVSRVCGSMQLLQQQDIVGRTSELARVFGIQFYHVLTRGSQYRVESMMLRVAKPMNYIPVTPSIQQRAQQRAPQCIPLVMEPESRFYSNSVVVLDFQSLYPSIVIAYNYCYSTCLGHVDSLGTPEEFKFGCTSLRVPPELLYQLRNHVTVSPNGIAFVKPSVRRGVLPCMLEEILNTRIMVKQSMKAYRQDKSLTRLLDARQLGLKLISNVTFGYTAASYSGRMPSVEVGDSIVHKARETLERAIKMVNDTKKWGARVVYGDTDSMFVLLKGATKEQAFKIGNEIAEAVTATNPKPVKLKFEKVYLPCVLQTKKRYVGYKYESPDQKEPAYDAKGIETVRRDACPAVAKILERSIKLLFESRDVSQVKQFVQRQCVKVLDGRASMQDLTFAKEYRGSGSYRPGACVPALELTRRMMAYDRRLEPRVGERVPYVVVYGMPGVPLIQLVRRPLEVLQDGGLRLNATYYVTKQILPPLARIFQLIGVDVFSWYQQLPRVHKASCSSSVGAEGRKGTISQYFTTLHCPVCDQLTQLGVCTRCRAQPQRVAITLHQDMRQWEGQQDQLLKMCRNCSGGAERQVPCVSLDCPVLYRLSRVSRQLAKAPYLRQLLEQF